MNVEIAKKFAIDSHKSTNQKYGERPYDYHLEMTASISKNFIYLIPENDRNNVISACWCHDIIEDVLSVTFNILKNVTNEIVAKLAQAVTNNEGLTRKERANDEYYERIRNTKYATFVKLCDRIANVQASLESNMNLFNMYKKEHEHFKSMLYTEEYKDMWILLDFLIRNKTI